MGATQAALVVAVVETDEGREEGNEEEEGKGAVAVAKAKAVAANGASRGVRR